MEIRFKGTLAEFQALFGGSVKFEVASEEDLAEADDIVRLHRPPLAVVASPPSPPPEPLGVPSVQAAEDRANAAALAAKGMVLPELTSEQRKNGWRNFKEFCAEWVRGFEDPEAEQPDRLSRMQALGQGPWTVAILVMAYETGSLQRLVEKALLEEPSAASFEHQRESIGTWLDYVDRVAANMVQVSHMGFPDLIGTYDYSTKWKRS